MHRVKIESLAYGGYGVARIDGKVCFVHYGVPGDDVLIGVYSEVRGVSWANIVEIYEPSIARRTPPCPLFETCGGCQWLHIDEQTQIEWKKKIVESAFDRIGKFEHGEIEIVDEGIRKLGYRTRAQFHFEYNNGLQFGFHEPRSHGIVDLDSCPLLFEGINQLLPKIKTSLREIEHLNYMSSLRLICNPSTGKTLAWVDLAGGDESRIDEVIKTLSTVQGLHDIDWQNNISQTPTFKLDLPGTTAYVPAGSFSQASFFHNEILINLVSEMCGEIQGQKILDIYCGWGNLSLPLAAKGASVIGYDIDPDAISAANASVFENGFANCTYKGMTDLRLANKMKDAREKIHLIILDPPRTGAKQISKTVAESHAEKIIYVSCDPNTLARDLKIMIDCGRHLDRTFLIDMIPQTCHIETVNILS